MDPAAVEGLHGTLSSTGVIVLDEAIVVALGLSRVLVGRGFSFLSGVACTYILVGDDFNILHMASRLKDLAQNILGDPLVEATDIEGSLVRLGGRSSETASTGRRHHVAIFTADSSRDRVIVGGDVKRRGCLAVLRRGGGGGSVGSGCVSHDVGWTRRCLDRS